MAVAYITELKKYAIQEVPGVDAPTFERVCRDVTREFCEQTQGWICELDPMNLREDVTLYELDAPDSHSCIIIPVRVRIFEEDEEPVHPDAVQTIPYFKYMLEPDRCVLHLVHAPQEDKAKALHVQVALRPTRDGTMLCERFYDDWYQGIGYGVMSRLMLMPGKQWSNERTGRHYNGLYYQWIGRARIDRNRRFLQRPMQARAATPFARGGGFGLRRNR